MRIKLSFDLVNWQSTLIAFSPTFNPFGWCCVFSFINVVDQLVSTKYDRKYKFWIDWHMAGWLDEWPLHTIRQIISGLRWCHLESNIHCTELNIHNWSRHLGWRGIWPNQIKQSIGEKGGKKEDENVECNSEWVLHVCWNLICLPCTLVCIIIDVVYCALLRFAAMCAAFNYRDCCRLCLHILPPK